MRGLHAVMQVYLGVCEGHHDELEHLLCTWVNAAQVHEAHGRRCVLLRAGNAAVLGAAFIAARRG